MSYLEMAKRALAELRHKRLNDISLTEQAPSVVKSFMSSSDDYAFPWPDQVTGLGPRHVGPFDPCAHCGLGSWVRYGDTVMCLTCAKNARPA